jgi:hypothetical protein
MLKSFSLKFQQSYKSYWGNKRGRTNKRRNTKFLQDLDLVDSPHKERDLIGRNVDLDLLFLFPQKDSRSIGGVEGKGSSQGQQWWRAQRGRGSCPRRKKGGLNTPSHRNMTVWVSSGRIFRAGYLQNIRAPKNG